MRSPCDCILRDAMNPSYVAGWTDSSVVNTISAVTRLWQKQAMPAPETVCLLKLYPNWAEIGYFGAKTLKFIHLPTLAQIPGYVTAIFPLYSYNKKNWRGESKKGYLLLGNLVGVPGKVSCSLWYSNKSSWVKKVTQRLHKLETFVLIYKISIPFPARSFYSPFLWTALRYSLRSGLCPL